MPSTIEQRILEMRFDNKEFEKNANQSINTLDRLDRQLQLQEGTEGLTSVNSLLQVVSDKFSILGTIGDQVIRRITDSVVNLAGKIPQLIKSLSIDQVTAGWEKYGEKTSAVQTIMAATAKDWNDTGKQMEFVNGQLDKLNWFTDETSYSFLDMVNNIGKFTSNNVKLEDAVTAMEGISTWAAISGANVQEAGRAMYNLSQAMAVGNVKLMDWKSIENANMATREFKDTVLATAVAEGTLTRQADGMYRTLKGHLFTAEQFNTQLSDGWFSSKVLMKTLDQYGSFANKLQDVSEQTDYTATELLLAIKKYKTTGEVVPELRGKIEELASAEYDLGLRAFSAAQEAKTFSEAISSIKDAVSTGWMNTFETIFGNYEEAKTLWTDFANGMYEIFAEGGNERNRVLKEWRNFTLAVKGEAEDYYDETGKLIPKGKTVILDGRKILMDSFYSLGSTVLAIIETIKDSFHDIFPKTTAEDLIKLTVKFNQFVQALKPSEEALKKISNIFKGLFATLDIGRMFISSLYEVIKSKLSPIIKSLGGDIFNTASNLGEWLVNLRDSIKENDTFTKGLHDITVFLEPIVDWLKKATDAVKNFFEENLKIEKIKQIWESLKDHISKIGEGIQKVITKIKDAIASVFNGEGLKLDFIKMVGGALAGFFGFKAISNIGKDNPLEAFLESLKGGLGAVLDSLGGALDKVGGALQGFTNKVNAEALKSIAIAVAILAAALVVLASIDSNKLAVALMAVTASLGELILSLKMISGVEGKMKSSAITSLIKLAAAVLILALALKSVADLDLNQIGRGLLAVGGIMAELLVFFELMSVLKIRTATIHGVIQMAIAIGILAGVIYLFSLMDPDTIGQGFLYMAGTLAALTISLAVLGSLASGGKMLAAGTAMIEMALAILVLAGAIAIFGAIPIDNLIQGFVAFLAVLLFAVAGLAVLSAMSVQVLASAAAMLIFAAAIVAIAAAIAVLSLIPLDNLIQGIGAFLVLILAMAAALAILSPIALAAVAVGAALVLVAASIVIAAAGLVVLALAIEMLQGTDLMGIAGGLAVLGAALIALGVGCVAMGLGVIGAAALVVFAVGLAMLEGIDLLYIAAGYALIGPAFILLAAGGVALGLAAVGLVAGSVALLALGLALYPFSDGLHQLDDVDQETILKFLEVLAISVAALAGLGLIAEAFAAGFAILGAACLAAGAGILAAGEGIKLIVDSILAIPDDATKKLKNMAQAMADVLLDHGKEATKALEKVMKDLVKTVENNKAPFDNASKAIAKAFSTSFKEGINSPVTEMAEMLRLCVEAASASIPMFSSVARDLVNALSSGILDGSGIVADAVESIILDASYGLSYNLYNEFEDAGYNIAIGVANGIYRGEIYPITAIRDMSIAMRNTFNSYNEIQSPSRLYAKWASYIPIGVAQGIDDNTDYATDSITDMSKEMNDALIPALGIISGLLDGSIDLNPTIRPVVDMSNVYGSTQEISDMFSSANVGAYASVNSINSAVNSNAGTSGKIQNGSSSSMINNVFNIYGQSGQSVDEIADAVERKLNFTLKQRKAAGVG